MFTLCLVAFLFARRGASAEGGTPPLTGWYEPPNERGTWDIIVSCVLTLTICVWSALHLNVPSEESKLAERNYRRVRWVVLGLFAPELVVSTAFGQFLTARWLRGEIRKDVLYRKEHGTDPAWSSEQQLQEWSITQCYYAVMGGIRIQTNNECIPTYDRLSLTAEGVRMLSFLGRLPEIDEGQIDDKSKADGLAKFLVVLQAGWMIIQTLARVHQKLPVTLLEINTMGHVVCAFALYGLWWSKPLDIKDPTTVPHAEWQDRMWSLMWMCSPICWHNDDFISEIRCLQYTPPAERHPPSASPSINIEEKSINTPNSPIEHKPQKTHFSVGSIGAQDPIKFIGPLDQFQQGGADGKGFDHNVSYAVHGKKSFKMAKEHTIFFQLQKPHHGLHHSAVYCRRALKDCDFHDELSPSAIRRWELACFAVDDLWTACLKRPEFTEYFFTLSTLGSNNKDDTAMATKFVGELAYIADHAPNFPGLGYLGSVNVHRDALKFVVAFAGAAYGGLHLAAWHDFFPTVAEKWLWMACALATGASGVLLALFFLASQKVKAFEYLEHFIRNSKAIKWTSASIITPLFLTARIFIVVEAFISLRRQPADVYKTPEWSEYLPHL
ncbi:hypothetical protein P171DRAFT_427014 [Karstenula rhodostoma CBS 690.94]|uniref:Uncharacterized protein n=1 Tax=Karstenula rhodostoma CBS 690.94 TaxID=1392251 RepID=A0A9P4PWT6_9PLEO|nr:hypothetical protein P171DRAFT_427014 [Karstenula rhodostoma CBS 690.94]